MKETTFLIENFGPKEKTFRLFGSLPSVQDNEELFSITDIETPDSLSPFQQTVAQVPGGDIYMGAYGSNFVSVIDKDTNELIASINIEGNSMGMIYANGRIYACGGGRVTCINPETNTVEAYVPVGSNMFFMAYCPENKYLYASDPNPNTVHVIDTTDNSLVGSLELPGAADPIQILYIADVNKVYCLDNNAGKIYVIMPEDHSIKAIPVTYDSLRMVYHPFNQCLYIVSRGQANVSRFNVLTDQVEGNKIPVGPNSFWPAIAGKYLYVPSQALGKVFVINTETNEGVTSISCGSGARYCTYNPADNNIYVSNSGTKTITVIDPETNTVISTLESGISPQLAFAADNGKVYVPNHGSASITVVDSEPTVKITVDDGEITLQEAIENPVEIGSLFIQAPSIATPLVKRDSEDIEEISLLSRHHVDFSTEVTVLGSELKSRNLDKNNYLEWVIPGNSKIYMKLVPYVKPPEIKVVKAPDLIKKYIHGN